MSSFRRSQRIPFQLEILFKGTYRVTPALTEDVSFHGVFIRTDQIRAVNQLIRFGVVDPMSEAPIELLGIVARCVTPEQASGGRPPGIGVSLFGNDRATEARWVGLIRRVKAWAEKGYSAPPAAATTAVARQATPPPEFGDQPSASRRIRPKSSEILTPPPPLLDRPVTQVGVPPVPRAPERAAPPPAGAPPPPPQQAPGMAVVRPGFAPQRGTLAGQPAPGALPPGSLPPLPLPPRPDAAPPPPPELSELGTPPPLDTIRRAHVRRPAQFNVTLRPEGIEDLAHFELKDISEGGTFVLTSSLIPLGSRVNLKLIHPNTGATYSIAGSVVRAIDSLDPKEKGIGIRFDEGAVAQTDWDAYITRNAPLDVPAVSLLPREATPGVRVLRTPKPEQPLIFGHNETTAPGSKTRDPGGAPILLGDSEEPVPIILGRGVSAPALEDDDDEPPPLQLPALPPGDPKR